METRSSKPFARALGDLLREQQDDPVGRVNLRPFLSSVKGRWGYDGLRQMINGSRTLQPDAIEAIAKALGVNPRYFREYRHYLIDKLLRDDPDLIDDVFSTLEAFLVAVNETPVKPDLPEQEGPSGGRSEGSGDSHDVE